MKIKTCYFIIFLLAALYLQSFETQAANRVKIVTIGGGFNAINAGADSNNPHRLVDRMKEFWKRELDKVMHHKPDLILLTEVCDNPGGLNNQERDEYYRVRKNQIQDYFGSIAKENRCYIAFGTKRDDNGIWRNSIVVMDREGKMAGVYNKNYPIIPEMNSGIAPCDKTPLIQCDFGTVVGALCFDLNFDELRERNAALRPDIILFASQWHGGLEQAKWAFSCRSFFVCSYSFRTFPTEIRNPFGYVIASSIHSQNYAVATVNLDRKIVLGNPQKITALQKKYGDKVMVNIDDLLGQTMITSEHEQVSAADMVKEFEFELMDNFFERAKQIRTQNLK